MAIETYGEAFDFYIGLVDSANRPQFKTSPTIAAGDFKISVAGAALTNLANLPVVTPAGSKAVKISLTYTEMTGETVVIIGSDASGSEWDDVFISITPEPVYRRSNLMQIDGNLLSEATLNLKKLNIINNSGTAIVAQSTGGTGHGIYAEGSASTTAGIYAKGGGSGTYGNGITAVSGGASVSSGNGLQCVGDVSGSGISASGPNGIVASGSNNSGKNDFVGSLVGNLEGNVTGSVASVTGNVGGTVVGGVASVTGSVGSVVGNVGGNVIGSVGSIATVRPKKNTGMDNFMFPMFDSTTKAPKTGLTITSQRAIDGNPFVNCTNSAVELSGGSYRINLTTSDMNGDKIMLKFTADGADDQFIEFITQD